MVDNKLTPLRRKVRTILRKRIGPDWPLADEQHIQQFQTAVQQAFRARLGKGRSQNLSLHMTDWSEDLEFLLALLSRPKAFSPKEIRDGLDTFLLHGGSHIAAAARIAGWPVRDLLTAPPAMEAETH